MKHKHKGFKENPVILIEKDTYKHQKTKKIKKVHRSLEGIHFTKHLLFRDFFWPTNDLINTGMKHTKLSNM